MLREGDYKDVVNFKNIEVRDISAAVVELYGIVLVVHSCAEEI